MSDKTIKETPSQFLKIVLDDDSDGAIMHFGHHEDISTPWPYGEWHHIRLTKEQVEELRLWIDKWFVEANK
jgi:hypothetical protein